MRQQNLISKEAFAPIDVASTFAMTVEGGFEAAMKRDEVQMNTIEVCSERTCWLPCLLHSVTSLIHCT